MIIKKCLICKEEFITYLSKIKIGRGKFCSKRCKVIFQKGKFCGKPFKKGQHPSPKTEFKKNCIPYSKLHPECMRRGISNPAWKGGRKKTASGYVLILKPEHPFHNNEGYVREHRLVVEKYLGRYLKPSEQCHHINKIKDDNRPKNLITFVNKTAHNRFEHSFSIKPKEIIFDGRNFHN